MNSSVTLLVASLALPGFWLPEFGSDGEAKPETPAYVAPYGLTADDLGAVEAPQFLAAVLGKGTEDEQEAALAALAKGRQEGHDELAKISGTFRRKRGVQAAVWRDTSTGKLKWADDKTRFDKDRDRVELVFARLDARAVQAQPKEANPVTPGGREWAAGLAQGAGKAPQALQAVQALPGTLGGSGDPASGNIIPLYGKAKRGVEELQQFPVTFTQGLVTPEDAVILVLVACEYPDKASRVPSRVGFFSAVAKSASGRFVENKEE
jgi:hypothetical protein